MHINRTNVRRITQMSSPFLKSVFVGPTTLGILLLLSTAAIAAPDSNSIPASGTPSSQVAANDTKSEANNRKIVGNEVKPEDWQYSALQGVASKYGCETNLNNKTVSTVDFARGLNTCLTKFEPMLASQPNSVTTEDLEVIKRLTQEFRAQLSEVDNRINQSDKKIALAQSNQFSTTTKLKGEAIFNVSGAVSGADPNNTVFGNRVRLLFESSFTGKDRLWTRLAAGSQSPISGLLKNGATGEGTQVFEGVPFGASLNNGGTTTLSPAPNTGGIDWLAYQFPVNSTTNAYVAAFGGIHVDYVPTYGGSFDDGTGGNGALTLFGESSPIYKIGGGAGVGTSFPVSDTTGLTSVTVGYLAGKGNSPAKGAGLFNGDYAALVQANFKLSDKLDAGLTYVNSYHTAGSTIYGFGGTGALTGSSLANTNATGGTANSYGAEVSFKPSDTLALNAFVLNTNANKATEGSQSIWSYGGGVTVPNVDGKGGSVGLLVGAEPYVSGTGKTPFHIEGFYKYKLSDNLSVTPGLIYLTSPNQIDGNGAFIGVVRTTFTF
jgi:Carbohydrate-selective porin, OprB family